MEINFFIFFANSKIVQARLVLSLHSMSGFIAVVSLNCCVTYLGPNPRSIYKYASVFSGSLTRLLRYTTSLDARRTTVRLRSIKAASLAMRAKLLAKNKSISIEVKKKLDSALKRGMEMREFRAKRPFRLGCCFFWPKMKKNR